MRREVGPDQRDRDKDEDEREADLRPRLPPRSRPEDHERPARGRRGRLVERDGGRLAHCSDVRSRGLTRIDEHVREHVEDDVDGGDQHRERLHDRDVAVVNAVDERRPDPGVAEHVLDHDDAAGEVGEVEGRHLDRRARPRSGPRAARRTRRSGSPFSRAIST